VARYGLTAVRPSGHSRRRRPGTKKAPDLSGAELYPEAPGPSSDILAFAPIVYELRSHGHEQDDRREGEYDDERDQDAHHF